MKTLSDYLQIDASEFEKLHILDTFIDIDTNLFVDPLLLKNIDIVEFSDSRKNLEGYFAKIIKLLSVSTKEDDIAWRVARKLLIFQEVRGVAIGYGKRSSNGSGVGMYLANKLIKRGYELVQLGIKDPEVFELIGLFEEGFGADRLSDMTIKILKHDFYTFTENAVKRLGIKKVVQLKTEKRIYTLPRHPNGKHGIIFLPKNILKDLPVAVSWADIDNLVAFNSQLRAKLNALIGDVFQERNKKIRKDIIRERLFKDPENIKELINTYRSFSPKPYDFSKDPKGEFIFNALAKDYTKKYPIELQPLKSPTIEDIEGLVNKIVEKFRQHIEYNGLNKQLYDIDGFKKKLRPERYTQLLFYAMSDVYCDANNIDLNRESNAGSGSVDFKYSYGYDLRYVVELKHSANNLLHGYEKQLKLYKQSENAKRSAYVVIQVANNKQRIIELQSIYKKEHEAGNKPPKIFVLDGRLKPSASLR